MIGQDTLDRIRRETDLVALIGESLKLQKRGRSFVGLCPFHKEKTPSFHVNPERGFYHCFGCHESGDALKFVQKVEGLEFIEAVRRLADRAGIEIIDNVSEAQRREQAEARRRSEELYDLTELAAAYFERMLREHPLCAYAERELERRGLVPKTPTDAIANALQAFRVGYAPYGWDGLAKHFREQRANLAGAERVGLVVPKKSGAGYYDRFRHRLMFAVLDQKGRVIAFSGRALEDPAAKELESLGLEPPARDADKPAKYINSPESPIYRKREALFGIHQARQAARDKECAILVEGNFDVVSLHAHGQTNVLAPLGTAFTPEQATQLKRLTQELVLLFDGDAAGRRAVRAAREVCQRAGLIAKVAALPEGVDPDELVRTRGLAGLERTLGAARPLLEYLIDGVLDASFKKDDARGQAARIKEVTDLLASEDDPTVRLLAERHADSLASMLGISDAKTFEGLRSALRRAVRPAETGPTLPPASRARSRDQRNEIGLEILGAFFDFPELAAENGDDVAELLEGESAAAYAALRQAWAADLGRDPEDLLAKLPATIHAFARARFAAPKHQRLEDARIELSGNVRQLKALGLRRETKAVAEELGRGARDAAQEDRILEAIFHKARQAKALASD